VNGHGAPSAQGLALESIKSSAQRQTRNALLKIVSRFEHVFVCPFFHKKKGDRKKEPTKKAKARKEKKK
jgi:hypothetical protein